FDPASDNQVRLIAQWRILGDDDRALYAIEKSELTEVMGGTGFAAQVAAQSRLLARLSEAIAARIKQLGSSK
ncbi:MAG TPA: ABC-type transport auxiliary lipoprotein family protein, partial [Gammaproteobacteria bacterium]|nr:ABC-type transport auxiliary lipoprotein family protein [Gammaproteobacteria bacterium]